MEPTSVEAVISAQVSFLSSSFREVQLTILNCVCILFLKKNYLFLAVLGLCCCTSALSSCSKWGYSLVAVHGLLIAVASLVAQHRL